jgi:hypothetical protein
LRAQPYEPAGRTDEQAPRPASTETPVPQSTVKRVARGTAQAARRNLSNANSLIEKKPCLRWLCGLQ